MGHLVMPRILLLYATITDRPGYVHRVIVYFAFWLSMAGRHFAGNHCWAQVKKLNRRRGRSRVFLPFSLQLYINSLMRHRSQYEH